MPDLSDLSDEQLQVYHDLLAAKQGNTTHPATPQAAQAPGFLSHLGSTLTSAPGAIYDSLRHPLDSLKAWRDQSQSLHDAALSSAQEGDYQAAAVHGVNFLFNLIPGLGKGMDDAAMAKTPEEFKSKLGDVIGTALLAKGTELAGRGVAAGADALIPNIDRANANFSKVSSAVGSAPVDVSRPAAISQQVIAPGGLGKTGSTVPKIIRDMAARGKTTTDIPFDESRQFQSRAGYLSSEERMATDRAMKGKVKQLASALAEGNEDAANNAGVGDLYRSAINEYRRAMKIQDIKDVTGEFAGKYAAHMVLGAGAGAGYGIYKELSK